MTIQDWKEFVIDRNNILNPSWGLSVRNGLNTAAIPKFPGQSFPNVPFGNWLIYPHFGTIDGKRAVGWNEGVIEYYQYAQNNIGNDMSIILKCYPVATSQSYWMIQWGYITQGDNAFLTIAGYHNRSLASERFILATISPADTNEWDGLRVQFRWLDGAKTQFEFKCFGNKNDGNGWKNLIPASEGGRAVFTSPADYIVPDNDNCAFAVGGGIIDNSLNRRVYYDNFSIKRVSSPPL